MLFKRHLLFFFEYIKYFEIVGDSFQGFFGCDNCIAISVFESLGLDEKQLDDTISLMS